MLQSANLRPLLRIRPSGVGFGLARQPLTFPGIRSLLSPWTLQSIRSRSVLAKTHAGSISRRLLGGGWLLAGAAGWTLWLLQKPKATVSCDVKCEDAVTSAACMVPCGKTSEGFVERVLGLFAGLATHSLFITLWLSAIAGPFILIGSVLAMQWKMLGISLGLLALPHIVSIPRLPFTRRFFLKGVRRWQGPPGTCRLLDFSSEEETREPEPEPAPSASKKDKLRQLFCYHPHGIMSVGAFQLFEHVPGLMPCAGPVLYHAAPLFRIGMESLLGVKLRSAASSDLHRSMRKGESPLMLVPGGFHEATITCSGHERVYLKRRMGFVKYALRYGYDLVPVYTVGEHDVMANAQGGWSWRFWLNNNGIPAVLPFGWVFFPLFPRRGVSLVTAVGPPVKMPHIPNPTNEEVNEHHARYVKELQKLYDKVKKQTASEGRKLEIW